jgi:hypothetical protein
MSHVSGEKLRCARVGHATISRIRAMTGSPAVRQELRADPTVLSSLTPSTQLPRAVSQGSPAQRVLTQGARQLLMLGRRDLADELAAQAMAENDSCADTQFVQHGARVALACNPTLRPFFAGIPGIETLLSPPPEQPSVQVNLAVLALDAWVSLLSLPHWFGTDAASILAEMPYWTPNPTRVNAWRKHLAEAGRQGAVRIFRQAKPRDWSSTIAALALQLNELFAASQTAASTHPPNVQRQNLQPGAANLSLPGQGRTPLSVPRPWLWRRSGRNKPACGVPTRPNFARWPRKKRWRSPLPRPTRICSLLVCERLCAGPHIRSSDAGDNIRAIARC